LYFGEEESKNAAVLALPEDPADFLQPENSGPQEERGSNDPAPMGGTDFFGKNDRSGAICADLDKACGRFETSSVGGGGRVSQKFSLKSSSGELEHSQ